MTAVDELSDSTEVVEMEDVNFIKFEVDRQTWDSLRKIIHSSRNNSGVFINKPPHGFQFIQEDQASPNSHRIYCLGELEKLNTKLHVNPRNQMLHITHFEKWHVSVTVM